MKTKKVNVGKIQYSPTSTTTPSKTSPWKQPNLIPVVDPNANQIGPTRLKLIFDDDQESKENRGSLFQEETSINSSRKKFL